MDVVTWYANLQNKYFSNMCFCQFLTQPANLDLTAIDFILVNFAEPAQASTVFLF